MSDDLTSSIETMSLNSSHHGRQKKKTLSAQPSSKFKVFNGKFNLYPASEKKKSMLKFHLKDRIKNQNRLLQDMKQNMSIFKKDSGY